MARKSAAKPRAPKPITAPDRNNNPPPREDDTIVFFHPDLGIGGAERLVVDAAVGLQNRGHKVVIFTNHCDPNHCFDECRDGKFHPFTAPPLLIIIEAFKADEYPTKKAPSTSASAPPAPSL